MSGRNYDAVVVGAGSVGNPTALFLAEAGLKVLVLDKRAAPGQGENKSAIGGVRATHSDPAKIQTALDSLQLMSTWKETYGTDIGWKPGGYCFPAYSQDVERALDGILPIQKSFGLDIDWVDADGVAEVVPGINRQGLIGGTYSPGDGQVCPLMTAVAVERAATEKGAQYRYNETVTGYGVEKGQVFEVITDRSTYSTPCVVVATGADAARDGEALGIEIPVFPDSHEAGISAPIKPFLPSLVVDLRPGLEGRTANFYFGQIHTGQIIFCYTPRELFPGTSRESLSEFMPTIAKRLISVMPRFRDLLVRRVWRGLYPMTPDGIPIVDQVREIKGLYLGVGMCGQGFMLGPGVARNLTSMILNGESTLPAEVQRTFRFNRDFHASTTEALK